jgi:hypothetical protein
MRVQQLVISSSCRLAAAVQLGWSTPLHIVVHELAASRAACAGGWTLAWLSPLMHIVSAATGALSAAAAPVAVRTRKLVVVQICDVLGKVGLAVPHMLIVGDLLFFTSIVVVSARFPTEATSQRSASCSLQVNSLTWSTCSP